MKAYSVDLRSRVVKFVEAGGSKVEAARGFGLGRQTIYRYLAMGRSGSLQPKKSWGHWRKLDPDKLRTYVESHPDATLKELEVVFGVSHNTLWVRLNKMLFTLKKSHRLPGAQRGAEVAVSARSGATQKSRRLSR